MSTFFISAWILMLVWSGALMLGLNWAATSQRFSQYRVRTPGKNHIPPDRKIINVTLNNTLALLIFISFLLYRGETTLYAAWPGSAHVFGETFAVLLLYDFAYYFYHRGMHHPKIMKYIHGVHHKVRFPTASESIYLHPLEQMGALALLLGAMTLLGPISEYSFLAIFFIYSSSNIIVHANILLPHPAFRLFNFWVEKHDTHHDKFKYNYASIFPFWDQAFGTYK
ncbi:MAG: sterol desaturase family protein [Oceanococcus sp.]